MREGGYQSGNLKLDAPGLHRRLLNKFPDQISHFEKAYKLSHQLKGCQEPGVERQSTSFNPRPARICHILLETGKVRNACVLIAAIISPAELSTQGQEFRLEQELALVAQSILRSETEDMSNEDAFLISLANRLDELRHVHMHKEAAESFTQLLNDTKERFLGQPASPANQNLLNHLKTCVSRIERLNA